MKIVIFGASGKTGIILTEEVLNAGHNIVAYVRNAKSVSIQHPNLKVVEGQLSDLEQLSNAMQNADACISTLGGGSLTKRSPLLVSGVQNIINTMEKQNVSRFIYMSSFGANESANFMPQPIRFLLTKVILRVPLADHNQIENEIFASSLNWTIVRPGGLTNTQKTEQIKHGSDSFVLKGNASISRLNVVRFILDQLNSKTYAKKSVWIFE